MRDSHSDRGQLNLDFVVGVSVFLLILALTLSFVPQMFVPFDDKQERPLVSDRVSDRLLDGVLRDAETPSVLNDSCTFAFFGAGPDTGCAFDASDSLTARLGLGESYHVNVSIRRNLTAEPGLETLCTDGSSLQTVGCSTRLSTGPDVPTEYSSVSSTHRTVYLDGRDVRLLVRVW